MRIKLSIIVLLLAFTTNILAQDEATMVKVGDQAPDFSLTLENGEIKMLSDLKGKVVWINFFATWCPPCRKELPHLEKDVYNKYKDQSDFEVLVSGREHSYEELNKFKKDNNYSLPFYSDPKREAFSKYASQNIPRNFIVDKTGKIVVSSTGFKVEEFNDIIKKVEELLKQTVKP